MSNIRKAFILAIAFVALAGAASAQTINSQCPSSTTAETTTQDACQKAIDLFQYMAPQLGTSITGGNATLGFGGTLGGLGHFSLGIRANFIPSGSIPKVDESNVEPAVSGAEQDTYEIEKQIIGLPSVDAAIGIFKGLPLGFTNVGGIDLLVSANYLPEIDAEGLSIKLPDGSLKLGYGARVGLLQETLLVPGVSVTYLRRDLPKADIFALTGSDSLIINGLEVKTTAWRVVASKKFFIFGLAAGAGKDNYDSEADIRAVIAARTLPPTAAASAGPVKLKQDLDRTNVFLDLSINLPLFKIIGEIGQVSGGTVTTYNRFDGTQADDSRTYGSVGFRFGF